PGRGILGHPATAQRLGFSDWLASGDRDDARLRCAAQGRAADRALSDEQDQRGLRPTCIRQGPLSHRCGRRFLSWRRPRNTTCCRLTTAHWHVFWSRAQARPWAGPCSPIVVSSATRRLGGEGILKVDGNEIAKKKIRKTLPFLFPEDETFDV